MAQGLVFWSVHTWWPEAEPLRAAAMGAVSFAVVAGLATQFAWTGRDRVRLLTITGLTGAVFALCAMWVWLQIPPRSAPNAGDGDRVRSRWVAAFVALYALGPYLQIYQRTGRPRFAYGDLFFHSWCNFFIGATGLVYTGVFWALLLLWGGLFKLIGIGFFEDLFSRSSFLYLTLPTVFAYGVANGRANARVTEAARGAALAVFRLLMPLLAVIALVFAAALPVTGLQTLWSTSHASLLLLTLIGFTILFLNAVFEDGQRPPSYVPVVPWRHRR